MDALETAYKQLIGFASFCPEICQSKEESFKERNLFELAQKFTLTKEQSILYDALEQTADSNYKKKTPNVALKCN